MDRTSELDEIILDEHIPIDLTEEDEVIHLVKHKRFFRQGRRSHHLPPLCRRRVLSKSGRSSVYPTSSLRSLLGPIYIKDIANTLINCDWKWTLLIISGSFFLIWLLFACIWMIISLNNGDLEADNDEVCLTGIQGFAGYLMFSIETQTTIGFGNRFINHICPEAVVVLCLQLMLGTCICGVLISIVFEKISGPQKISPIHSFSRNATVRLMDGMLTFAFRVRDCDRRYQCQSVIKAFFVHHQQQQHQPQNPTGRTPGVWLESLKLESPGILLWPLEVVHKITSSSPLWDVSARDLIIKRIEIIVVMEGTCLYTSNPSRTCTSYISNEILWGHRFQKCVRWEKDDGNYIVHQKLFNKTKEILTPLCSAKFLDIISRNDGRYFYEDSTSTATNNDSGFLEDSRGTVSSATSSEVTNYTISSVTVHRSPSLIPETNTNGSREKSMDPLFISLEKFISDGKKYIETHF